MKGRCPPACGDDGVTGGDLGILMLCVLAATFPLVSSLFGGGEGLASGATENVGAGGGGFGARFGLPWLTRAGRSDRSDVESDDDGAGACGAEFNDVMLPPKDPGVTACSELLFLCSVVATWGGSDCSEDCC